MAARRRTLLSAVQGTRLDSLITLRDTLARAIDARPPARDLAALSRQLTDVLAQIAAIAPEVKAGDPVDEISQRRAARGAGPAKGSARAGSVSG